MEINNNYILNYQMDDIDEISNKLNKTSTNNKKFNKKNKYYETYSRIVEEECRKWFYVILENNDSDIIQSDTKTELLENYKNIKKIKFSRMEPTWYRIEKKIYNDNNKFVWKSYDFVEANLPYYLHIWNKINNHNNKITENWKNKKIKPNNKKGVIYSRTSIKNDISIDNQVDTLFEYCLQNNMYVDYLIEDDGISGWFNQNKKSMNNFCKKSELNHVVNKLKNIHILLLYRVDRLGRYQPDTQKMLDYLSCKEIDVYFYYEKINWNSNMKEENRHFIKSKVMESHISSQEKSRIAKQTNNKRKSKGIVNTNTPYGYRIQKGIKKPILSEQKNLKTIIKLYKKKLNFAAIARYLNNLPAKTRLGNDFSSKYVKSLFLRYKSDKAFFDNKDYYVPDVKNNNNLNNNNSNNNNLNNNNSNNNNLNYSNLDNLNSNENLSNNNIIIENKLYEKIKTPDNKHCFYHSVAYQLNRKLNINYSVSHLRIITSNYMEKYRNEFIDNYDINYYNGLTYDDYVKQIRSTNIWADNNSIIALQKCLKINIHIFTCNTFGIAQIFKDTHCQDNFNQNIKILYNGINNYNPIKKIQKINNF